METQEEREELTELLEESIRVSKANNKLLRAMRRDALIMGIIKVLIWGVLLGGSVYFSLKFLEPLLIPAQKVQQDGGAESFKALLDIYNGDFPTFESREN